MNAKPYLQLITLCGQHRCLNLQTDEFHHDAVNTYREKCECVSARGLTSTTLGSHRDLNGALTHNNCTLTTYKIRAAQ